METKARERFKEVWLTMPRGGQDGKVGPPPMGTGQLQRCIEQQLVRTTRRLP